MNLNRQRDGQDDLGKLISHSIDHAPELKGHPGEKQYEYFTVSVSYEHGGRDEFLIDEGLKELWAGMDPAAKDAAINSFYKNNRNRLLRP